MVFILIICIIRGHNPQVENLDTRRDFLVTEPKLQLSIV